MAEIKYSKAVKRLNEIITSLESEDIDVDDLASRVKEAVELIRVCKAKIQKADMEVRQVVEDFEEESSEDPHPGSG
mgnify:CR=1 FL=1